MSRETDVAWAAGLFEGEGCFSASRSPSTRKPYPIAVLAMTDRDVVERFASIVGVGYTTGPRVQKPGTKPMYYWRANGVENFRAVVELFLPYLGERRRSRALGVLTERDAYDREGDRRTTHRRHAAEARAISEGRTWGPVERPTAGAALP